MDKYLVTRAIMGSKELSPTEKHVMHILVYHINRGQSTFWPSEKLLAEESGYSDRTIRKCFKRLQEKNWLLFEGFHGHTKEWSIPQERYVVGYIPEKEVKKKSTREEPPAADVAPPEGQSQHDEIEKLRQLVDRAHKAESWPDSNSFKARTIERGRQALEQLQALGALVEETQ